MKNKKILMTLVTFLVSLILISCGLGIKDTVQDVTSEIHRESSKEDTEGLGIKQVLEQKNGEKMDIAIVIKRINKGKIIGTLIIIFP